MSTINVILGLCAASLAVGSAVASVLAPPYKARGANGATRDLGNTNPCPTSGQSVCKVKLVTAAGPGHTILGFTAATVLTVGNGVLSSDNATPKTIIIED